MNERPVIVWLRRDLRLADNPALHAAARTGAPVIPLYVFDEAEAFAPGAAAKWRLHYSLDALSAALRRAGARLTLRRGRGPAIVRALAAETEAAAVFWNRRYAPAHVEADKTLKTDLVRAGLEVRTFNAGLLREPWEIKTKNGGPFRVYTPFWKALRAAGPARAEPLPAPKALRPPADPPHSDDLDDWRLLPRDPDWAARFADIWRPGEAGAQAALARFLDGPAGRYAAERDRPDRDATSRLSHHLAFGEIGPLQVWRAIEARAAAGDVKAASAEKFLSELAWREFSCHLLFHNPALSEAPLRKEFVGFPWRDDPAGFKAWRRGRTGYPIVDAGMRELWRTGWMHNRVRMIAASFLVKDLLIDWRRGAAWFWDTLIDADPANNSASWQWVAGCGADAAPYFRIFNPVAQGEKFDPQGDYVRRFVPELAKMPPEHIHAPWRAPPDVLDKAGVVLGKSYPEPILDHAAARKRALAAYERTRRDALAKPSVNA
ncbi:cryptochrome/photolyase family protein [Amphiplicatus metriothermophilus]|uniref:Deoxyribodipyrimidine photo-lyase n=1 Tax=Amphiplicatus metriothermophilus TaxID=1519374 RepID=A0A239PSL5_9PROT|nr:deoxyribodipyrimidine photo-lyase [Amphiplicatus metriothermophilus]MBB5519212.1 deoxyribodipyrimidine photo-lyase [Amphiplicatus metriothermophilus]SNT73281.1 deoxyribodipyrimidine photo-lyase [Amphiplicatus metriothermophilus]